MFVFYLDDDLWPGVQILGVSENELMGKMGEYFVNFVSQYGYDRVLSVLGRHMRDFLNGESQHSDPAQGQSSSSSTIQGQSNQLCQVFISYYFF